VGSSRNICFTGEEGIAGNLDRAAIGNTAVQRAFVAHYNTVVAVEEVRVFGGDDWSSENLAAIRGWGVFWGFFFCLFFFFFFQEFGGLFFFFFFFGG